MILSKRLWAFHIHSHLIPTVVCFNIFLGAQLSSLTICSTDLCVDGGEGEKNIIILMSEVTLFTSRIQGV